MRQEPRWLSRCPATALRLASTPGDTSLIRICAARLRSVGTMLPAAGLSEMHCGFRKDQVKTPILRRLRQLIQQLKRISQTGSNDLRSDRDQGSIIIAATAAQTLS